MMRMSNSAINIMSDMSALSLPYKIVKYIFDIVISVILCIDY